jgi:hypothetical protein
MNADGQTKTGNSRSNTMKLKRKKRIFIIITVIVIGYALLCYIVLPMFWVHYEHHPVMSDAVKCTVTKDGIPADPLNVGLIGTRKELIFALISAGWLPADPITLHSSLDIVASVLLHEPYENAPVSNLYLYGRKQDLAFEKIVDGSPKERHHVRFWCDDHLGQNGRPMWIGSATYDRCIGLSHRTGQITHHIDADIDAERDKLMNDLVQVGELVEVYQVTGIGPTLNGHNGGGDRYFTDGELNIGVISSQNRKQTTSPIMKENPTAIRVKNKIWNVLEKRF